MKQPLVAPAALGGSVIAGVAAMLIGGYRITDCLQYREGRGYCDEVVTNNAMSLVAGVSAIVGSVAGLFTYNPSLERPEIATRRRRRRRAADLPPVGSPFGEVLTWDSPAPSSRLSEDKIEDIARQAFREAIEAGEASRAGEPAPPPPPAPPKETPEEKICRLAEEGWSQQSIADHMETTVYQVRKALGKV